ncbi:MAG: hypothetical protein K1Y02_16320 [Candidatus Hydrogenedentes bacterium]|nr:hypothetical protein [Candidatus Hydrogenedentota bacterium]
MIPTNDPVILIERSTWFNKAFRGLCKPAAERLQSELEAHYDHVFRQSTDAGKAEMEAHRAGMTALGNAKVARRSFCAKYLTEWQYRRLEKDGAFNSPRYSREMDSGWGICSFFCLNWAGQALTLSGPFYAGGYALASFLAVLLAAVVLSLRGRAPRGEYAWVASLFCTAFGVLIFGIQSYMAIRNWSFGYIERTPHNLDWVVMSVQLLFLAFVSLRVCWHIWQIKKARNTGVIGPKRNKSIQPN